MGYLFALSFEATSICYLSAILICVSSLYFGFCIFLVAYAKCFKNHLDEIEQQIKTANFQENEISYVELKKNLYQINLFYCDSIQLSHFSL